MNVERIALDKHKARELYREYKKHQHYSEPIDAEIQRTYKMLAQGRTVIKALESIKVAGLNAQGLPKLAIVRADHKHVDLVMRENGSAHMDAPGNHRGARGQIFSWPEGSFPQPKWKRAKAATPIIPIHLRPKRGLANYHVLWEAEWEPVPPRDPYLLRRLGGDMWLVVAAWNLTEVERAAMATRLSA